MTKELIAQVLEIDTEDVLTAEEAGELLGIQHRSVLKAISRGRLPATRAGNQWYLNREDIEEYNDRRKQ